MSKREVVLKDIVLEAPWRASESLDPINEEAVDEIAQSVREHAKRTGGTGVYGDTGGIVLLQIGDKVVCVAGRHRVLGFIKAGIKTLMLTVEKADPNDPLFVGPAIDTITENALQRTSEAELGAVAIATKMILRLAMAGRLGTVVPKLPADEDKIRGNIASERGLGRHTVLEFLRRVSKTRFPERMVKDYFDTLKTSGEYARLVREVAAEFPSAPDEEELPKGTAKSHKKGASPKPTASQLARAAEKVPVTFNAECAKILPNPAHLRVFKKIVTKGKIKEMLTVADQPKLAARLVREAKAELPKEGLTSLFIRERIGQIVLGIKKRTKAERKEFIAADQARVLKELAREFQDNIRHLNGTAGKIIDLLAHNKSVEWPPYLHRDIGLLYRLASKLSSYAPDAPKQITHRKD